MAISKITTNGFNFANTLSRGDFTDSSFGDIVLLENEVGGLLMDSSASGVDVDGHILYNNNESAFFFRDISSTQLSDGAVTLSKISSDTKDQLNEDHIALENEDGNLLLNSSAASTDEGDRIVFNEVFNPSTFNIDGTLTAGNAIKIDSSGLGFEFGSAGGLVKLFQGSAASAASFEINSTYINSTYDKYLIFIDATPATDAQRLRMRFLQSDSVHTGSDYFYETEVHSSSTHAYYHDADDKIRMCYQTPGNAAGEGINVFCTLTQVNSTSRPTTVKGDYTVVNDSASSQGGSFNGGQDLGGRTSAITGIHLYFASGNIIMNDFAIYGVVK